ncbi:MAG: Holliday junction resolvase RuvX [Actinobacteria bacterium]|nr:Holliday junction resolvase RuvX [Actinomycetota bacterium]
MRYVGLDYGQRRIGISVSDSAGRIAVPSASFTRSNDLAQDLRRLASAIREFEPDLVVVGYPVSLSGQPGSSVQAMKTFVGQLKKLLEIDVIFHDERFTTAEASRLLRQANMSAKAQRSVVDASAAAVMLQSYLDKRVDE